ncbi:MAG: hypothetical protein R2777_03980 [Chitinophagales bacterium]
MKKSFILVFIALSLSLTAQINYADYYFLLNQAVDAKQKNNFEDYNKYLIKAYDVLPRNQKEKAISTHYTALVKMYAKQDPSLQKATDFIKNNKIVAYNSSLEYDFKNIPKLLELLKEYDAVISPEKYYIKNHEKLSAILDTLNAIDQYVRKNKGIDSTKVKEEFKSMNHDEISHYNITKLKELWKEFGLFGPMDCYYCDISLLLIHLDNTEMALEIEPTLKELVKLGKLEPNAFAWAFDRAYNTEKGTFIYYFSLNPAWNTSNYTPVNELSDEQKAEINAARKEIGIPPLPYSFTFISSWLNN